MERCLHLASLGSGMVAPNPMVGAVLVHDQRIIGEGYHQYYGGPHAEVNCIHSVKEEDLSLIPNSTLYVSLEPCSHHGKTPPCTSLIIKNNIKKVVIGTRDPFPQVNGKGLELLRNAGIEVITNVLQEKAQELNKRFFTYHQQKRPYLVLKWAQTSNGFISGNDGEERLLISNAISNRLVHKWRAEEMAILIGRKTALNDNPRLDNRLWYGHSPLRLIIDPNLNLPTSLHIYSDAPTWIFNCKKNLEQNQVKFIQLNPGNLFLSELLHYLYEHQIQSVLVEGGAFTFQQFLFAKMWDEARVITNTKSHLSDGIKAPEIPEKSPFKMQQLRNDRIDYYSNSYPAK